MMSKNMTQREEQLATALKSLRTATKSCLKLIKAGNTDDAVAYGSAMVDLIDRMVGVEK